MSKSKHVQDREAWQRATTLEELGELMALWLEGRLFFCPSCGGYGEPDPETNPLRKPLAYFNRHGLLTTCSQPGMALDDEGCAQRACVDGWASEAVAKRLAATGLYTDLLVLIYPPGQVGGYQIPVTLEEFRPFTWMGPSWGQEELDTEFGGSISQGAMAALASAWKVVVIDPRWGRSYLWTQLRTALVGPPDKPFSVTPARSLQLGSDFVY